MTEVEIKVDNVAKSQQGVVSDDKWYNFPKGSSDKFEGISRGDIITLALDDDGKVVEYKLSKKAEAKKAFTAGGKGGGYAAKPTTPENIRQTVVNAVLGSPWLNTGVEDPADRVANAKEMMVNLEKFITGGKF